MLHVHTDLQLLDYFQSGLPILKSANPFQSLSIMWSYDEVWSMQANQACFIDTN